MDQEDIRKELREIWVYTVFCTFIGIMFALFFIPFVAVVVLVVDALMIVMAIGLTRQLKKQGKNNVQTSLNRSRILGQQTKDIH